VAYSALSFVHKLSFILLKKPQFSDAGMALSYASNIQKIMDFFLSKVQFVISRIVFIYDCAVYDGNY